MNKATIDEILSPSDARSSEERARRVREKFWRTLKRAARQIPFMEDLVAAYYCAFDTQTPTRVRGILLAALAYFVLPVDIIPDFIAGFGFTDDVAVLSAAITAVRTHITPAHYAAARASLAGKD
ncbi:MAG TPA: YkvA family protein [Rhizobiaceae bacterium]|nr:YkvA family protein [Rhizobiaceae bacterium]